MIEAAAIDAVRAALPSGLEPRWERQFRGRFRWELNALQHVGVVPEVDLDALGTGRLAVTLEWPLNGGIKVRLRAVYPDSFPHMRPQVFLLSGPENLPLRHRSPREGNLCLLGRDTRQWMPSWTLAKLLMEQLQDALYGTGDEDPQGEPADFWWNSLGAAGACCLVDSGWGLQGQVTGTLRLRYVQDGVQTRQDYVRSRVPIIRSVVAEVRGPDAKPLHQWQGPLPPELASAKTFLTVPWIWLPETIFPSQDLGEQVRELRAKHDKLRAARPHPIGSRMAVDLFAVAHPVEIAHNETGIGWVVFQVSGQKNAFSGHNRRKSAPLTLTTIPVYRAGPADLGHRVPAVDLLREKRVLVVGTGAIGAPVAIELARNGCGTLHLLEHDRVEPGNTVRWPLGASAWGRPKLAALKTSIEREFPATSVNPHPHFIGFADSEAPGDDDVLQPILANVDLVVDASASHGVTTLLAERCRANGIPLISVFATPTVDGGAVVRHAGPGGCPNCLLHAWHEGEIVPPPGNGEESGLSQPPGCAERTFIGAGYDLQELSLQTVRLTVTTLAESGEKDSLIQTLSFIDEQGRRGPPIWRVDDLPKHANCGCRPNGS